VPLLYDFLSLVIGSIGILTSHHAEFVITLVVAFILAGLGWIGAANYSKLWNLGFRTTATHALLCFMAALLTFVFVVLFASFKYTKDASELSIDAWRAESGHDLTWENATHKEAYGEIEKLGIENFTTAVAASGTIPLTQTASRNKLAEVYSASAIEDFQSKRPFLSKIVWTRFAVPEQTVGQIEKRISQFFISEGSTIPGSKVVEYTAEALKEPLHEGTARVVPVARSIIVLLFFLVQLVPFGLIGWAAWRDLKITV
jgi:hypothetical protein